MNIKRAAAIAAIVGGVGLTVPTAATAQTEDPPDTVPLDCEARDPKPETFSYYYRKHAWSEQGGVGAEFGFQGGSPSEGPYSTPQASFSYQGQTIVVDQPFMIGGGWYIVIEEIVGNGDGDPGNVPPEECFAPDCTWPGVKAESECGTVNVVDECGSVSGTTTFQVEGKAWSYAVWFNTSLPTNPADGTPGGLSFEEDAGGGSVSVNYWVAGTENDAFQGHSFPTWDSPATVDVDTDCRPPQPPDETHTWTDYEDWTQGEPACGEGTVTATRGWVSYSRTDTYTWDAEANAWVVVHGEKQVVDEGTETKTVEVEVTPCPTTVPPTTEAPTTTQAPPPSTPDRGKPIIIGPKDPGECLNGTTRYTFEPCVVPTTSTAPAVAELPETGATTTNIIVAALAMIAIGSLAVLLPRLHRGN